MDWLEEKQTHKQRKYHTFICESFSFGKHLQPERFDQIFQMASEFGAPFGGHLSFVTFKVIPSTTPRDEMSVNRWYNNNVSKPLKDSLNRLAPSAPSSSSHLLWAVPLALDQPPPPLRLWHGAPPRLGNQNNRKHEKWHA